MTPPLRELLARTGSRRVFESLAASAAIQFCLVVSGVLVARLFDPGTRGAIAIALLLPAVAAQLVGLGIPSGLTYFIARHNRAMWPLTWRTARTLWPRQVGLATALLVLLDVVFVRRYDADVRLAALVCLPAGGLLIVQNYALHAVQGLNEIRWFNILRTLPNVLYSVAVLAVFVTDGQPVAIAAVWVVAQGATTAATLEWLRRAGQATEGAQLRAVSRPELVRYGVTGFLAQISPVETFRFDQLFVAAFLPPPTLGLYVVASSVSNVPRFIADAVSAVAFPAVASRRDDMVAARRLARRSTLACAALCAIACLPLALSYRWLVPTLFGRRYAGAVPVAEVLLLAAALVSVRRVASDCGRALGLTTIPTIAELVSWVVLTIGFATLGLRYEGVGVAISLIVATLVAFVIQATLIDRSLARPAANGPPPDAILDMGRVPE